MSYRAFKRLLGETRLQRKSLLLLGTMSVLLITLSFWLFAHLTERIAYDATANSGRLLIPLILRSRHDAQLESRAAMEEFQQASEDRWSKALSTYSYKFLKPKARNPANRPDPDETALVEGFFRDPDRTEESRQ